jgi:hypothetical protein
MIFILGTVTFSQREWDGSVGVIDSEQEIERRIWKPCTPIHIRLNGGSGNR